MFYHDKGACLHNTQTVMTIRNAAAKCCCQNSTYSQICTNDFSHSIVWSNTETMSASETSYINLDSLQASSYCIITQLIIRPA